MTNKDYINDQLKIRFSPELYYSAKRGSSYHFMYGYKRIVIEIFKSFLYIVKFFLSKIKINGGNSIALYSTRNQCVALENALKFKLIKCVSIPIYSISLLFNFLRFLYWLVVFFVFPFVFIFDKDHASANERVLLGFRIFYIEKLVHKMLAKRTSRLYVSNDHVGDVFLLTICMRDVTSIKVGYVQHGAVKINFPHNFFDEIYIYDNVYKDIYMALSLNPKVKIIVNSAVKGTADSLPQNSISEKNNMTLVCLSHSFRVVSLFKALAIVSANAQCVRLRFHPSDRMYALKYFLLKLFFKKLSLSDSSVHYGVEFKRSSVILCASSSILLDALNNHLDENMYWFKSIGLEWDYYSLGDKLKVISNFSELKELYQVLPTHES